MNTQLLLIFIGLNIFNVIVQTVKSLATVKCGKIIASLTNAVAYGLYTIVTIYMLCELPIWWKAGIVALCNLIGVFVVKWIEEKLRKDRLWKVEATVYADRTVQLHNELKEAEIPHNFIENIVKYRFFNAYCETQTESTIAKEILNRNHAKYFVSESKIL